MDNCSNQLKSKSLYFSFETSTTTRVYSLHYKFFIGSQIQTCKTFLKMKHAFKSHIPIHISLFKNLCQSMMKAMN